MLLFAVVEVQRQAAAVVGRGFLQQIALGALNDIPGRGPAVFCRHAHGLESAVIHGQDAAGVNAVVDVGRIVHPVGLPEQAHDVADVVDIQVHEGTAGAVGIKRRGHLPRAERIVPAGILAEIALHQLHRANAGQQLPDLIIVFQILGGQRLKEEDPFVAGEGGQLFGLGRRGGHGLFHNDMLARFQRHFGIAGVLQIGDGQIDHIHPLQQLQVVGGALRHMVPGAELRRQRRAPLGAAQRLHLKRRVRPGQPGQKLLDDHPGAQDAKLHLLFHSS